MKSNLYQDCWPPSFADGPVIGNEEPKIPLTTDEKIEVIKEEVSKFRRITFEEANSKSRKRELVMVRQEMMKLMHEFTPLSLKKIGRLFSKAFDHSTICHAKDTIADLCFSDKQFKMQHELIRSKILSRI
mgnify:FL=1